MSRIAERMDAVMVVLMFGKYEGDIAEASGIKGKLTKLAETSRYRLFHGGIPEKYYIMVSQGTELAGPKRVIITVLGKEENEINKSVNGFSC